MEGPALVMKCSSPEMMYVPPMHNPLAINCHSISSQPHGAKKYNRITCLGEKKAGNIWQMGLMILQPKSNKLQKGGGGARAGAWDLDPRQEETFARLC